MSVGGAAEDKTGRRKLTACLRTIRLPAQGYSARNAPSGSIRDARRAGNSAASAAIARKTEAAAAIVRGSYAVTPNRSVFTHRAAAIAATAPNASPTTTGPTD